MVNALYLHNFNRPKARFTARLILDIKPLAGRMDQLPLPGLSYPPVFLETYQKLSYNYQNLLSRVSVFTFASRKGTTEEYQAGLQCTRDAAFFLNTLETRKKFQQNDAIVGFRCTCCINYCNGVYVKGSTSFVNVAHEPRDLSIYNALKMRMQHLMICPCVSDDDKSFFAGISEAHNIQESKLQHAFVSQWTQALLAAYFPSKLPVHLRPIVSQVPIPWLGGGPSLADMIISDDLEDAVSLASQLIRKRTIVFDDMQDKMEDEGLLSTLLMDLLSQIWHIRVTQCHETKYQEATLYCTKCNEGGNLQLPGLMSRDPLPNQMHKDVRDFVLAHVASCHSVSLSIRQVFLRHADSCDDKFWHEFCSWWQTYLSKLFRSWEQSSPMPKRGQCDLFRCITVRDKRNRPYSDLPFLSLSDSDSHPMQLIYINRPDVIVLENELYQNLPGNRWFRRQVSKHRSLYLQVSESQKSVMAETILNFVTKSGYAFIMVIPQGNCVTAPLDLVIKNVMSTLANGFPELLRPPQAPKAETKVFDVEYAPMIGIFHGSIQWTESCKGKEMSDKAQQIFDKDEVEATRYLWGDSWRVSPQRIFEAVHNKKKSQSNQQLGIQNPCVVPIASTTPGESLSALDDPHATIATVSQHIVTPSTTEPSILTENLQHSTGKVGDDDTQCSPRENGLHDFNRSQPIVQSNKHCDNNEKVGSNNGSTQVAKRARIN